MQEIPNKSDLEETEENIKNKQIKTSKQTTQLLNIVREDERQISYKNESFLKSNIRRTKKSLLLIKTKMA